jgi:hypothetical protein
MYKIGVPKYKFESPSPGIDLQRIEQGLHSWVGRLPGTNQGRPRVMGARIPCLCFE